MNNVSQIGLGYTQKLRDGNCSLLYIELCFVKFSLLQLFVFFRYHPDVVDID